MPERLQKLIARAGISSRRKAEALIAQGKVTVNGEVVRELGTKADPEVDSIQVDGRTLNRQQARRYLALHKPKGCITSTSDPEGRPTVMDLLGRYAAKGLFPVGRLDYNTEGLLLLTDDGDFANKITSPKNAIPKTYEVKVSGRPSKEALEKLRLGVKLDGRITKPESLRLLRSGANPWYEVTLVTGRNRQIHRMFERVGVMVEKIRRVRIGPLTLRGLEPRQVRELQPRELQKLLTPKPPTDRAKRRLVAATGARPARSRKQPSQQSPRQRRTPDRAKPQAHAKAPRSRPSSPNRNRATDGVRTAPKARPASRTGSGRTTSRTPAVRGRQTTSQTPAATNAAPTQRRGPTLSRSSQRARAVSRTYPKAVAGTAKLTSVIDSRAMNAKNETAYARRQRRNHEFRRAARPNRPKALPRNDGGGP